MTWEAPISPQTLVDEIDREGAPHGLCGYVDEEMGAAFVCEVEHAPESYGGLSDCSRMGVGRRLMAVDHEHPMMAVMANRILPGETDPAERYRMLDAQIARRKQRQSDDQAAEFKSVMARSMRGGAIFHGGTLTDGAANRQARRIREAMRRRGGG